MQHVSSTITLLAFLSSMIATAPAHAAPSGPRPIQVISDPYSIGNPTHYTIIRGHSKVTFSHPLNGQFVRAEISTREQNATILTRYVLSPDRQSYRLALRMEIPFEKHFSLEENAICPDPSQPPLKLMNVLNGKVADSEQIAKKREELTKAKFFDESCFDPKIKEEHRNAIFNATADILSLGTQDTTPEPKYLRCLEKFGFAHESGVVQALVKQSLTDSKVNPRIRLSCTADRKAKPGTYDDQTKEMLIKTTFKPNREDYASKIFHELVHAAPMSDNTPLVAMEECCTKGERCDILKEIGLNRKKGDQKISIAEFASPQGAIASSELTALVGPDNQASQVVEQSAATKSFDLANLFSRESTAQCKIQTEPVCESSKLSSFNMVSAVNRCYYRSASSPRKSSSVLHDSIQLLISKSHAEQQEVVHCNSATGSLTDTETAVNAATSTITQKQNTQLSEAVPTQTSPLLWDTTPQPPVQIRLGSNIDPTDASAPTPPAPRPSRTIASIAPLPDARPDRKLGSANNRRDVSSGRATALVDTLESAARSVSQTLTPEKLESVKIERAEIYSPKFKPKSIDVHYAVVSPATSPMKIAELSTEAGVSFPNPFANASFKVNRETGSMTVADAKAEAGSHGKPNLKLSGAGAVLEGDQSGGGIASGRVTSAMTVGANQGAGLTGGSTADRSPSNGKTHDFKAMDRTALVRFMTSSYRALSTELESRDFAEALIKNEIQVIDHEQRRIGSTKPRTTFIYREDLGRLVQTRAEK